MSPDFSGWQSYKAHVAMHRSTWSCILKNVHPFFLSANTTRMDLDHPSNPLNNGTILPHSHSSVITTVQLYVIPLRPFATTQTCSTTSTAPTNAKLLSSRLLLLSMFCAHRRHAVTYKPYKCVTDLSLSNLIPNHRLVIAIRPTDAWMFTLYATKSIPTVHQCCTKDNTNVFTAPIPEVLSTEHRRAFPIFMVDYSPTV